MEDLVESGIPWGGTTVLWVTAIENDEKVKNVFSLYYIVLCR